MRAGIEREASATPRGAPIGLYVHVPFCRTRCAFCAFYLEIHRPGPVDAFLQAFDLELEWHSKPKRLGGRSLRTIYFGGGTPTTLTADQLTGMLSRIRARFDVDAGAEITVEGHPDTVSLSQLRRLRRAGVTRLSLGAESMDEGELLQIGRPTMPQRVREAVAMAREAGFTNLNLDLMYGLPGQTLDGWTASLDAVVALEPEHLSCYALTVEDGTALADRVLHGALPPPDPELQTVMERAAEARLRAAGYHRYEISNYARPGAECRHNLRYWQDGCYVGVGPSAESYVDGVRFGNTADLRRYAALLRDGTSPIDHREVLTPGQRQREALVFGLRQLVGVERELVDRLSHDPRWRDTLDELIDGGLLSLTESRLRLTEKGQLFADAVALRLI